MTLSTLNISLLSLAYANQAPDIAMLDYFSKPNIADLLPQLDNVSGKSHAGVVKMLYHNLFDRTADAGGVQYWSALLDSGAITLATLPAFLVASAQGSDAAVGFRVQAAHAFSVAMEGDTAAMLSYSSDSALVTDWLGRVTSQSALDTFKAELPGLLVVISAIPGVHLLHGQLQTTGYLAGATVFQDLNGNGQLDTDEISTTTDGSGHYSINYMSSRTLPGEPAQALLATGGTDITTGLQRQGTPSHGLDSISTNSPLTLLYKGLLQQGLDAAQANTRLGEAFGVAALSVSTPSPLQAVFDADPGSAAQLQALSTQATVASLDGLQLAIARTLVSLAGGAGHLCEAQAALAVSGALADTIAHASGVSDLGSASFITALLASSVAQAANADLSAAAAAMSSQTSHLFARLLGDAIDNIMLGTGTASADFLATLAHIGQASTLLQATLADQLASATAGGHLEALLPTHLASALALSTPAVHIGDLDPGTTMDSAAIAYANSGAGVPAFSALDIEKLYVAFLHRPADPLGLEYWLKLDAKTLTDGLSGASEFTLLYAGMSSTAVAQDFYQQLFGRAGDDAGVRYWAGLVDNGALNAASLATSMVRSAQGSDAVALNAKTLAAAEFTASLDTAIELISYTPHSVAAVNAWLAQVKDYATLAAALDTMPQMDTMQTLLVGVADAGAPPSPLL
ncbi:DUF4214 domain-containing protein [Pseudoduganella sp. LjRoot289]|uniref:DUF4214 domain-containing protein n=1 Tax=Pseudoduganella sp. LjRoot289 TaxID=3342314 RepID=UPI003ECC28FD